MMHFLEKLDISVPPEPKKLHLMYGEDLEEGLIRKQVEDLRSRLDPSVYRAKKTKAKDK